MDEIPNSNLYNQAGNGGPQVKDLFVFHQSTVAPGAAGNLAMDTTDAALFNVCFHDIREPDFSVNQPAAVRTHAHVINFNGDNDGLAIQQAALHLRDDPLPAGVLATAQSFFIDDNDIVVDPSRAGGNYGFPAGLINGNTIFHEMGHKVSLRHCVHDTSQGNPTFPAIISPRNGTDVNGDGNPDGAFILNIPTYIVNTTIQTQHHGLFSDDATGGPGVVLVEGARCLVNGVDRTGDFGGVLFDQPNPRDTFGGDPINYTVVLVNGGPIPGGAAIAVRGLVFFPDLMDYADFWIGPNGPNQQQNFNGPQFVLPAPPGQPFQEHEPEVRIRTQP